MRSPRLAEASKLLALATPISVTQLATMLLWTIDLLMVGHLGVVAMNAVSLGRLFVLGSSICAMGLIYGQDAIAAQAHGARDRERLGGVLLHSCALAVALSLPLALLWLAAEPILLAFGQSPEASRLARDYVLVQIPALPFFLLFISLKQYLQARGIVKPEMWIALGANGVHILLVWMFVFGRLGAPRLGVVGAGIATAISEALMFAAMLAAFRIYRLQRGSMTILTHRRLRLSGMAEILRLGAPLAAMLALEYWAFATSTLWAGRLGAIELAAHAIALNLASISYMVGLGVSLAATTRVGNLIGARQLQAAERAGWVAFALGGAAMLLFAVVFVVGRHAIPAWYTTDATVIALAATLLPIAALFELFDGLQVVGGGILRGMGRTRPAAVFNLVGYYVLGLPIAAWLGRRERLGLVGIWWGLAAGLFVVGVLAVLWVRKFGPRTARALVK